MIYTNAMQMTLAHCYILFHIQAMKYLIVLSLFLTPAAWAGDAITDKGTHISLSASASMEIPNDEAVVQYRIEATGSNAASLRKQVNSINNDIQTRLKQEQGLKQTTLSRRMEILWRYDKLTSRQVRDGWQLIQREQIVTQELDAVPEWVNSIETSGAFLDSLNFRIADSTLESAQKQLRLQAMQQFRAKAASLAKAMEARSFHVLNLQTGQDVPTMPMRAEMMMMRSAVADTVAPSLNAGESKTSVNISGTILLPEISYPVE